MDLALKAHSPQLNALKQKYASQAFPSPQGGKVILPPSAPSMKEADDFSVPSPSPSSFNPADPLYLQDKLQNYQSKLNFFSQGVLQKNEEQEAYESLVKAQKPTVDAIQASQTSLQAIENEISKMNLGMNQQLTAVQQQVNILQGIDVLSQAQATSLNLILGRLATIAANTNDGGHKAQVINLLNTFSDILAGKKHSVIQDSTAAVINTLKNLEKTVSDSSALAGQDSIEVQKKIKELKDAIDTSSTVSNSQIDEFMTMTRDYLVSIEKEIQEERKETEKERKEAEERRKAAPPPGPFPGAFRPPPFPFPPSSSSPSSSSSSAPGIVSPSSLPGLSDEEKARMMGTFTPATWGAASPFALPEDEALRQRYRDLTERPSEVPPFPASTLPINASPEASVTPGKKKEKEKEGSGLKYYSSPTELQRRLELLLASFKGGNNSSYLKAEALEINDLLFKKGKISTDQHRKIFNIFSS